MSSREDIVQPQSGSIEVLATDVAALSPASQRRDRLSSTCSPNPCTPTGSARATPTRGVAELLDIVGLRRADASRLDLQAPLMISYLFVLHDLSVITRHAHRVAMMSTGTIVEQGASEEVFSHPRHDYTGRLGRGPATGSARLLASLSAF